MTLTDRLSRVASMGKPENTKYNTEATLIQIGMAFVFW